ncbi:MAG: UbiA-like polyprenyltransferase [Vampirovibrionales bacterium]|nr:UbiA-like polyprenyltransferase [Vampirovibrionales bacterium]
MSAHPIQAPATIQRVLKRLAEYAELIKLEHSVFALPFALVGVLLATPAGHWPPIATVFWVIIAMVGGRTFAMALNRLLDAAIDAQNPRTQSRALASGRLKRLEAWGIALMGLGLLVWSTLQLPSLCLKLLPIALLVLVGYSFTKRFTASAHWVLGFALGCGAVGGWVAVTGTLAWAPVALGASVMLWVAGFDLIYACQDADFDRHVGLFSVPARYGIATALTISKVCHALSVAGLAGTALLIPGASWGLIAGTAIMSVFLLWEHRLIQVDNLDYLDMAFFTLNGWISVAVLGAVVAERLLHA